MKYDRFYFIHWTEEVTLVNTQALSVRHPNIMTRPLNMATPQSKYKAQLWLMLYDNKLNFQTENFCIRRT